MVFCIKNVYCYNVPDLINDNPTVQIYGQEKNKATWQKYVYKKKVVPFKRKNNLVSGLGLVVPFFEEYIWNCLFQCKP